MAQATIRQVLFLFIYLFIYLFIFFLLSPGLVFWLGDLLASQNPREFYGSHSPGWVLICAYTIW